MIKASGLNGKFLKVENEYILSIYAFITGSKDEFGKLPYEIYEDVKILDHDGFEIDNVALTFNPIKLNQEVFASQTFTLDDDSQRNEIKFIKLLNTTIDISKPNNKLKFEEFIKNQRQSEWIPELSAKIKSNKDETIISIKASICPQPNDEFYTRKEFYEYIKLLDENGFQITEIPLHFMQTKAKQITSTTVKEEFYDPSLAKKIKYLQLLDSIVCINTPLQKNNESNSDLQTLTFTNKTEDNHHSPIRDIEKSYCNTCNSIVPKGVEICDKCRSSKLKNIHGNETVSNDEANKKLTNLCEHCYCEVPFGAKICDSCRSQKLRNIHSGEKSQSVAAPTVQTRTPQSEWKPWPPKMQSNEIKISDINKDVKNIFIGILVSLIVVIFFLLFIG